MVFVVSVTAVASSCTVDNAILSSSPTASEAVDSPQHRMSQVRPYYETAPLGPSLFIEGTLRRRRSCTYLTDSDSSYLLLWPTGVFMSAEESREAIVGAGGALVAVVNQRYRVTGGPVSRSDANGQLGARGLSADCPGRLWQVTSVGPVP